MEATPGLPCLNLKSSRELSPVLHNMRLIPLLDLLRARRVAARSTHTAIPDQS